MDSDLGKCWNCKKEGKLRCEKCNFALYCNSKCRTVDQFRHLVECEDVRNIRLCHGCGKFGTSLLRCSSCYRAHYCSAQCQKKCWPKHKIACKDFRQGVLMYTHVLEKSTGTLPWYVGMTIAEDFLRLHQNEGPNTDKDLRLLFAGVGDTRHVLRTINDLPTTFRGSLHFVLNEIGPHVSARNLLFLYCALVGEPSDIDHLVQIWYSVWLTTSTMQYLVSRLKELATQSQDIILSRMKNVRISAEDWDKCVAIWLGWSRFVLDPNAVNQTKMQYEEMMGPARLGFFLSFEVIPGEHRMSLMDFIGNGVFLPRDDPNRENASYPNCTMTCFNPSIPENAEKYADIVWHPVFKPGDSDWTKKDNEMIYGVRCHAFVFNCWDYVVVKETVGPMDDAISMFRTYLKGIFTTVVERLSAKKITFHFVVDDFRNLHQHLSSHDTFDRISASNLGEYYHFPLILKHFGPLLNRNNSCSVLITHHENWPKLTDASIFIQNAGQPKIPIVQKDVVMRSQVLYGVTNQQAAIKVEGSHEDYWETSSYFLQALLMEAGAYSILHENQPVSKPKLAHPSEIAKNFGLRLRDFCTELNHVVPFKRECNIRRVSVGLLHFNRYLEWILPPS